MLILFDHGAPRGLARAFAGHTIITAKAKGWDRLSNGALLKAASPPRSSRHAAAHGIHEESSPDLPSFAPPWGSFKTKQATMTNLTTDNRHFTLYIDG
jgi:hypothetical protein